MRLRKVKIRNFRCYTDEIEVDFDSLTSIIGKNDAGKSTILEALAIFFDQQKPDADDAAKAGVKSDMSITCEFDQLPDRLVLDATSASSLSQEWLLNEAGRLEIRRTYNGDAKNPSCKVFLRAVHPTATGVADLLALKNADLKRRARELDADLAGVDQKVNAELRAAIRERVGELEVQACDIEVDTQPGAKELFARIKEAMPAFFLFRADRASTDQDSEAQDPMKVAVRLAIEEQKMALDKIAMAVNQQVAELIDQTLLKIKALSPELASELNPEISDPKWDSVFKISLTGDSTIPLNKRGSGVRRMVLLGFLQAQAESRRALNPDTGIIYAIEEPETSQHPDMQRSLLHAIEEIAEQDGYQVILTTHNPMLGRLLPTDTLRYVTVDSAGSREVRGPSEDTIREVARALGVLPDHDVRVFVGVEGKHDENFLKHASEILSKVDPQIASLVSLEESGRLIFIPVGGSNVGLWVSRLHHLDRPEYHIFDRDNEPPAKPHYEEPALKINSRENCRAVHTSKRELENYIHPQAISAERPEVAIPVILDFDDVPLIAAQKVHAASDSEVAWSDVSDERKGKKVSRVKAWLNNQAVSRMTPEFFAVSDPRGEITAWLRDITALARKS
ncbi:ATP-binding protein [Rhodococcus chondri]|uniref:ATP-binding protein n=1 Tax=Rhodococcus chondri TaxID=3065941 RepID=A0ABU7JSG8_9NOCA|nr:ATP-binding protein [Rhodococcus sp. CC-R104]MEE2032968.1 ATP-binding protein [Rhodococcus sp. CC-R104]